MPYAELLAELLDYIEEDADALGCMNEVQHARTILARGTSAHRQIDLYRRAIEAGATGQDALVDVVQALIADTVADL